MLCAKIVDGISGTFPTCTYGLGTMQDQRTRSGIAGVMILLLNALIYGTECKADEGLSQVDVHTRGTGTSLHARSGGSC